LSGWNVLGTRKGTFFNSFRSSHASLLFNNDPIAV
jgi:hypothetical protein